MYNKKKDMVSKIKSQPHLGDGITTEVLIFPQYDSIANHQLFGISLTAKTRDYTHGLHRFPAKFVPQIPRWALREFLPENGVAYDPFMGSGTSLVEGLLVGGTTFGTDIDPLARLITKAKTDMPEMEPVKRLVRRVLKEVAATNDSKLTTPMPDISNFSHWFTDDNWRAIQVAMDTICISKEDEAVRVFLLALVSSTLRWVSRADDQSQKTYVSGTRLKKIPCFSDVFERFAERSLKGLQQLRSEQSLNAKAIILAEGTATDSRLSDASVDVIVTSPPYLDSVDYMYNLMLEYFWIGPLVGVDSRADYNRMRRQPVGSKHPVRPSILPKCLNELISMEDISKHRQSATVAYFASMDDHFREAARVLKNNGAYVLVVGNSKTNNAPVRVNDCLVRLAHEHQLCLEKAFAYRIRRHYMKFPRKGRGGIILVDWVIVLRKQLKAPRLDPKPLPIITTLLGESEVSC